MLSKTHCGCADINQMDGGKLAGIGNGGHTRRKHNPRSGPQRGLD